MWLDEELGLTGQKNTVYVRCLFFTCGFAAIWLCTLYCSMTLYFSLGVAFFYLKVEAEHTAERWQEMRGNMFKKEAEMNHNSCKKHAITIVAA